MVNLKSEHEVVVKRLKQQLDSKNTRNQTQTEFIQEIKQDLEKRLAELKLKLKVKQEEYLKVVMAIFIKHQCAAISQSSKANALYNSFASENSVESNQ